MKIEWTEPAILDLDGIRNYIARDSEYYASRFVGKIVKAVEKLEEFPENGPGKLEDCSGCPLKRGLSRVQTRL